MALAADTLLGGARRAGHKVSVCLPQHCACGAIALASIRNIDSPGGTPKGVSAEEILATSTANVRTLFGL